MALDLSSYKVINLEVSSATKFSNLVQAVQDSFNAIGDTTKMAFAAGLIFDPSQIKQNGGGIGEGLLWNGSNWAPQGVAAKLADTTLGADSTIDFSSIPANYGALLAVGQVRSIAAVSVADMQMRVNNDSAANYDQAKWQLINATVNGVSGLGGTAGQVGAITGASATANFFSPFWVLIPNYAGTTTDKSYLAWSGAIDQTAATTNFEAMMVTGHWRTTATAINRLTFAPNGFASSFKTGSRITLYGLGI